MIARWQMHLIGEHLFAMHELSCGAAVTSNVCEFQLLCLQPFVGQGMASFGSQGVLQLRTGLANAVRCSGGVGC